MGEVNGAGGGFKPIGNRFLGRPEQKSPEQKLRDVSDMYEKHFLREMMKAMRSTVKEGGFVQSNQAEKIFKEQLDDQYVEKWGERGGIGLSDMIYKQLMDKFGTMLGLTAPVAKPQGPIPLNAQSEYRARSFQHPGKTQALSYNIERAQLENNKGDAAVTSPWDGVLLGKKTLADEQIMLEVEHDNGLKSQMVFKGGLSKLSTGQKLQAGETLGVLSSDAKSLYWTVEKGQSPGPETVAE
ncbi:MAG: rod-binding protein [Bdellovibrio sp.]